MQRKYSILLLKLSVRLLERLAEAIFRQMEKDPSNDTLRSMYCIFQSIICIHDLMWGVGLVVAGEILVVQTVIHAVTGFQGQLCLDDG